MGYHQLPITPYNPPDPLEQQQRALTLQHLIDSRAMQQEQLKAAQMENQQRQRQMSADDAFVRAYHDAGGDLDKVPGLAAQYGAHPAQVIKFQEGRAKAAKELAGQGEQALKNLQQINGIVGSSANAALQLPPEQRGQIVQRALGQLVQIGGIKPEDAQAQWAEFQQATQQGQGDAWLRQHAMNSVAVDKQIQLATQQAAQQETAQQNAAQRENWKDQRALQERGQNITMRGQNMTDARMREQNQIARETKQDQKRNAEETNLGGFNADMDRLASAANELKNHPGLVGITGIRGAVPNIPGGQAANAQAKFDTLKSQVAFGVLQNLRNQSKTGGALGQVSDREEAMLSANLASLDRAQSKEELQKSLQQIIDYANSAKGRAKESFDRTFSPGSARQPRQMQQLSTGSGQQQQGGGDGAQQQGGYDPHRWDVPAQKLLPHGNGRAIDKATAAQFYQAAGGDPAKARKMAQDAGWKVQ